MYLDSFGLIPPAGVELYMTKFKHRYFNNRKIQKASASNCGPLVGELKLFIEDVEFHCMNSSRFKKSVCREEIIRAVDHKITEMAQRIPRIISTAE